MSFVTWKDTDDRPEFDYNRPVSHRVPCSLSKHVLDFVFHPNNTPRHPFLIVPADAETTGNAFARWCIGSRNVESMEPTTWEGCLRQMILSNWGSYLDTIMLFPQGFWFQIRNLIRDYAIGPDPLSGYLDRFISRGYWVLLGTAWLTKQHFVQYCI